MGERPLWEPPREHWWDRAGMAFGTTLVKATDPVARWLVGILGRGALPVWSAVLLAWLTANFVFDGPPWWRILSLFLGAYIGGVFGSLIVPATLMAVARRQLGRLNHPKEDQ